MHFDEAARGEAGIETRVLGSRERRRELTYTCVYTLVWEHTRARIGLVVSLVFCDDDVFSVFRGMPRAALIVTELGPRATLVRMRAVALAFSVSLPLSFSSSFPDPSASAPFSRERR